LSRTLDVGTGNETILRLMEDFGVAYQLRRAGGSYAIIMPREWVETFSMEIKAGDESTYWVKLDIDVDPNIDTTVLRVIYPDKDEVVEFLEELLPKMAKTKDNKPALSDEELIDICRNMLRNRNLHIELVERIEPTTKEAGDDQ